jgi:hypothetical protein
VIDFGVGRWGRRAKPWPHVEPLNPVGLRCGAARRSWRRTRCARRKEWAAEHAEYLGRYGIGPAKLTKFKNAITAFDTAKSAPRQNRVTKNAAAQLLPQLVRSAVAVVRDQLDGLMVQFKDTEETPPAFSCWWTTGPSAHRRVITFFPLPRLRNA